MLNIYGWSIRISGGRTQECLKTGLVTHVGTTLAMIFRTKLRLARDVRLIDSASTPPAVGLRYLITKGPSFYFLHTLSLNVLASACLH